MRLGRRYMISKTYRRMRVVCVSVHDLSFLRRITRSQIAGRTKSARIVEVTRPPIMTVAKDR
jgi:hypothetical protein